MTLDELAAGIRAHLKRIEADAILNPWLDGPGSRRRYFLASAFHMKGSPYVRVTYVNYQGTSALDRDAAAAYLAWLDAGNVGRHHEQQREARMVK